MTASRPEQILARVQACLLNATAAGDRVERARQDGYAAGDAPAINIKRGDVETKSFANGREHNRLEFSLELTTQGDDYETTADALHVAAHALLQADPILADLGKGLRCINSQIIGDKAEFVAGQLTARYEIQFLTRPGDLAA